jgi:hypothetical protein
MTVVAADGGWSVTSATLAERVAYFHGAGGRPRQQRQPALGAADDHDRDVRAGARRPHPVTGSDSGVKGDDVTNA